MYFARKGNWYQILNGAFLPIWTNYCEVWISTCQKIHTNLRTLKNKTSTDVKFSKRHHDELSDIYIYNIYKATTITDEHIQKRKLLCVCVDVTWM